MSNEPKIHKVCIGPEVTFGHNCVVFEPVNLYGCKFGNGCKIGPFVEVQDGCQILDRVVISSHSFIAAGTIIGDDVFIGHGVVTCNDRRPVANNPNYKLEPITIGRDVAIGSGVVILPGVKIGEGALIGAGTVVTKDVPPHSMIYNVLTEMRTTSKV